MTGEETFQKAKVLRNLNFVIKICQNTPQLCWGDEWHYTLSPGGSGLGCGGNDLIVIPTLILPAYSAEVASGYVGRASRGRKVFRELDAPQLCCGVLHPLIGQ